MTVGITPTQDVPRSLLDNLLKRDQMLTGFEVFKSGQDLKKGLIDIEKVYDIVVQREMEDLADYVKPIGNVSR